MEPRAPGAASSKKAGAPQAPRLPRTLPLAELPADLPADGETQSRLEYRGLDLAERTISRAHLDQVLLTAINAPGCHLSDLRLEDVRFAGGNLANAVWHAPACARVEFTGCRMTGLTTLSALFLDTVCRDCKIDLAQFYEAQLRGARFEDCLLTGTDFRAADLTGAVFLRCDLSGADFTGAKLEGADLSGCPIDGMRAGVQELRGTTIDEVQALAVMRAMGVTIK